MNNIKQFSYYGTYTTEMNRSCFTAKSFGKTVHIDISAEIIKVHILFLRMENKGSTGIFAKSRVSFQISRISSQILCWTKLDRIDKHTDNHLIILGNCLIDQAFVSFVQISHSWHQTDCQSLLSPFFYFFSYLFYCGYNFHRSISILLV